MRTVEFRTVNGISNAKVRGKIEALFLKEMADAMVFIKEQVEKISKENTELACMIMSPELHLELVKAPWTDKEVKKFRKENDAHLLLYWVHNTNGRRMPMIYDVATTSPLGNLLCANPKCEINLTFFR